MTYDNDPIGYDRMKITNDDFNYFCMKYYYNFRKLCEAGLINPRSNSKTSPYKPHYSVENLKRPIKINPTTAKFDMVKPYFNDNKKIISVTTESKFVSPDQIIMINKDQGRKEGIEISRVSPSDEPNPMGYPWVTHEQVYFL